MKNLFTLQQLKNVKDNIERQCDVNPELQMHRCNDLKEISKVNVSIVSYMHMAPCIDANSKSNLSIGHARDLPRSYGEIVLEQLIEKFIGLSTKCYPECGIIFDGTPIFAEAEAIKVIIVTHEFEIVELLVRVSLFEKNLNTDNLDEKLIETILLRLGFKLDYWITTQKDRTNTNKSLIKKI